MNCELSMQNPFVSGLGNFIGLPSCPLLLTPLDPTEPHREGHSTSDAVSVFRHGNKVKMTADTYAAAVAAAAPDAAVALCDGETPRGCSSKRLSKAVSKTERMLDTCLERLKKAPPDQSPLILAALEGGYDRQRRSQAARGIAQRPGADGFLVDGFHLQGDSAADVDVGEVVSLAREESLPHVPASKPRLYLGRCDPVAMLELFSAGAADMFDTSYVVWASAEGRALNFDISLENNCPSPNESLPTNGITNGCEGDTVKESDKEDRFSMSMKDPKFKEDFEPLIADCRCPACRKHTRAYVHHLLATNELLGPVLLTMHNLHHYHKFVDVMRAAAADESGRTLEKLKRKVMGSLH